MKMHELVRPERIGRVRAALDATPTSSDGEG